MKCTSLYHSGRDLILRPNHCGARKVSIIGTGNDLELVSIRLVDWSAKQRIHIAHIQLGKSQQNTYLERYDHQLYIGLSQHYLKSIKKAKEFEKQ